jgi:hypothetical protein
MKLRAICLLVVLFTCNLVASPRKCGPTDTNCIHGTTMKNVVIQEVSPVITAEDIEFLPMHKLMGNL